MKTVFSNQQCAHVWAQQSQATGRGSSVKFDGPSFKSYGTTIARFVRTAPTGHGTARDVVLLSSQSYSTTTNGKHKGLVQRALRNGVDTYAVPTLEYGGWNRSDLDHAANLAYLVEQYRERGESLMRAAALYQDDEEQLRDGLAQTLDVATCYARDFGLPDPAPREISPASAARQIWARQERLNPGREAQRLAVSIRHREAERVRAAENAARDAVNRPLWRAGDRSIYRCDCEQGGAMLRLMSTKTAATGEPDDHYGKVVQTSHGANAPLADAQRGMRLWRKYVDAGAVYPVENSPIMRLGHFALDSIDAAGNVRAGCHTFYRAELEHFEKLLAERGEVIP